MTFFDKLTGVITQQNSLLCVGLDPDLNRIPASIQSDSNPILRFCTEVIDSTKDLVAAYKLNFAFFEADGSRGWATLEKLMAQMPDTVLTIADAKRADIGNSSQKYAEAILQRLNFDSITVNPYMGSDSVAPFIQWPEKGAFILALTSNPGTSCFQQLQIHGRPLYKKVIKEVMKWNKKKNCGIVTGATQPDELEAIRNLAPELPFLIPGIGAQGGSLTASVKYGAGRDGNLALINSSRGIIYKSGGNDFASAARQEAISLNNNINKHRLENTEITTFA